MSNTVDLAKLREDLDTATPHQSPPWSDSLTEEQFAAVCARAEQLSAADRHVRAAMRKPNS